ncbi:LSU ribosomal protein L10P [Thermovibrio guaymasensis]|uniref:Large ribosomal subunit protein uL10 n=1 Tax=Thermovibrio guaymasensis TaxID=240167 RepID=A0A420W754_9BACT|nr:50S ribosomal protein L10 [Thermovibrio guaymasensis]RKQ63146.1 LSU ribosomal protein L10P [Thermovibrio guaymasensis]
MKTRKYKEQIAKELKEKFEKASLVVLTNFQGMTVAETNQLRRKLREAGAEYKVVKNTLMRYAYPGTPVEQIKDAFVGPTGIVFAYEDIVSAAKALKEFMKGEGKEEPKLKFKAAVVEGKVADFEMINQLAELPSREELLGQLAFTLKYPVNAMAWSLENLFTKLVAVLENVKSEKEGAA